MHLPFGRLHLHHCWVVAWSSRSPLLALSGHCVMASLSDQMESLWAISTPAHGSARPPGKLKAEGGVQAGLPPAGQARVGLLSLLHSGILDGEFCGAPIGKGKKMCVKAACEVASHNLKDKVSLSAFGDSKDRVFIQVPFSGGRQAPSAVFLTPSISVDAFAGKLGTYLAQERTVDQWTSLFATLAATPEATSEEKDLIAEQFAEPLPPAAFTPRATKLGKRKADSPDIDLDNEYMVAESKFDFRVPKTLPTDLVSDSDELSAKFSLLAPMWASLTRNVDLLLELITIVYNKEAGGRVLASKGLMDASFAVSMLATKLGERPESLGTDSIYALLEDLMQDVEKLQGKVRELDSPAQETARREQTANAVGQLLVPELRPLFMLYHSLSSTKESPGDRLEERLARLEAGVAGIRPTGGHNVWFGDMGQPGVGQPSSNGGRAAAGEGAIDAQMTERIKRLEDTLKDVQDEMTSSSVQVGTTLFVSRSQVKAWMDLNGCPARASLFFLDAMSMLALIHNGSDSAKSAAEFASLSKKVGYSSTDEALVVTSFSLDLPEAFGSLPTSGVARDTRVLPALPSYKEWDAGDGYNGLRITLADRTKDFVSSMGTYYRGSLTGEALTIANEMLSRSKTFIADLSTWINTTYQDTLARTMSSEKEAWALLSHCVRVVFKLLRDARASGARWTPGTSDEQLVWAQMQCHRVMDDIRSIGFGAHPALSHVLNLHLQDNVVSRSRFEVLEKKLQEVEKLAREAKKLADKKVQARPAGGGAGGGSGN